MPLTAKQDLFVREYLKDCNATKAAIRAKYSPRTAAKIGFENLRKPEIAAAIDERRAELAKKIDVSLEAVVFELARIGFSDIRRAVNWSEGSLQLVGSEGLDDDTAAAVQEVSHGAKGLRLKLHSKAAALAELSKILGAQGALRNAAEGLGDSRGRDVRDVARRIAVLLLRGQRPSLKAGDA